MKPRVVNPGTKKLTEKERLKAHLRAANLAIYDLIQHSLLTNKRLDEAEQRLQALDNSPAAWPYQHQQTQLVKEEELTQEVEANGASN